ncbi:hypothetical protein SprV_0401455400 [Sparganum proliferum]
MTSFNEAKIEFCEDLYALLTMVSKEDKLIIHGDFNENVVIDHTAWRGMWCSLAVEGGNDNVLLFMGTYAEHRLLLTNTCFSFPTREKATWIQP